MKENKKVLFLLGPTGVGKSSLSIEIAQKYDMEIISADSVQVYKEFDIGSAKITPDEMKGVKHYGIDILSPNEIFSASQFVDYTKEKIEEIISKGKIPLIVGGTGLYVKSLVEGYNFGGTDRHEDFRAECEKEDCQTLFEKLKELNPEVVSGIDKNNKIRLIRALEIATYGSEKLKNEVDYDFLCLAVVMAREELYNNINNRAEKMIKSGLIEETKNLYEKYGNVQPLGAIGYKETLSYLKNEITKQDMLALISQHTRNYAKRQLTFLRGLDYLKYFDKSTENYKQEMIKEIDKWIESSN